MFKLIIKIAVVYAILQYGLKIDINGYVKPYIEPLIADAQDNMPESAKMLLEKAEPLADAAADNALVDYVSERANAIGDAKEQVQALEQKMKEMQEAADKAANGDN
jgi:hypothetical protein